MKTHIRRILNLLLYLSLCLLTGTGLLLVFRLVPGSRGGRGLKMLGWGRHDWGEIHEWASYFFLLLIVVHLSINRQWLIKVAASGHKAWLVAGLLTGALIIAFFFVLPVK